MTIDLVPYNTTYKAPKLEKINIRNSKNSRVEVHFFHTRQRLNRHYFVKLVDVACAIGFTGSAGLVPYADNSNITILDWKNCKVIDVLHVPALLNHFISIMQDKGWLTEAWGRGENAARFLQWFCDTVKKNFGVEFPQTDNEEIIDAICERLNS